MAVTDVVRGVMFGTGADHVAKRRTLFFAASVVLLLTVARSGAPSLGFGLALSVFLVASGLWLRGQYTGYLSGTPAVDRWWVYAAVLVLAIALGVIYKILLANDVASSGLLLGALVLTYFAIGGGLAVWRENGTWVGRVGVILAGLAVLLVLVGYWVLHRTDTHQLWVGAGLLGLGLAVCWPVAVAFLSERGTTFLASWGSSTVLWVVMGVGLVGALACGWWMWVDSGHSRFMVFLVVALGILTASVASSTRADIVLIIVALAVMGFTPGDGGTPPSVAGKKHVLVALGDSYMSGEGASIFYDGTDTAGEDTCRRAPSAWAMQAGRLAPFDGTVFLACSGAKSANIRTSNPDGSDLPKVFVQDGEGATQLAHYRELAASEKFTPELVVLSIGGNDAGFSTIGVMCLVPGNCAEKGHWWTGGLADVRRSLDATYTQVRDAFPGTPVVVTAYPDPIYRGKGELAPASADDVLRRCSQVALRPEERAFVAGFLEQLNETVREVAVAHHFYYLEEMKSSLKDAGLQLCDPANNGRPGLNFIGLRSVSGLAEQRFNPANWSHNSLHPNERGHQAMLETFERWLAAHPTLPVDAPEEDADDPAAEPMEAQPARAALLADDATGFTPVCSPLDPNPSGCRSRGTHWAVEETGDALVQSVRATQVVFIEAFWWVFVLGFFGWRRRVWKDAPRTNLV
ncbi:GDSL-type esterase/lipase family protein [Nocardioides halotolerans]|jgi:lysophospholipase L1-like esterase|uniref:GDSL-type esterase/lipase family protein n=1 Tax=Nocardioides halotolerans TaxID=433660 RepID=UPI00041E410C|nr:GDSL-type esterase/lipase family protein [Nocardioides halotolerans]